MKFGPVPLSQSVGKILAHNLPRRQVGRAFRKGRLLSAEDVNAMQREGFEVVFVAELEPGDVDENLAALRLAQAAAGTGLAIRGPTQGRADLTASQDGILGVDAERLSHINLFEGVAFATLRSFQPVRKGQVVAAIKIVPYALPESLLHQTELLAREGSPLLQVREVSSRPVSLLVCGHPTGRERLLRQYSAPLGERVAAFGGRIGPVDFVDLGIFDETTALAESICRMVALGSGLVILAGETSTMDANDVAPRAVRQAGGEVACVGAPLEPGNLLMLAQVDGVPVLGVPGCARSRKENGLDRVLLPLLAGFNLTRSDVAAMGAGGLILEAPPSKS